MRQTKYSMYRKSNREVLWPPGHTFLDHHYSENECPTFFVVLINTMSKCHLEEKGVYFILQIKVHHQEKPRQALKAENSRQQLNQRLWSSLLAYLPLLNWFNTTRKHLPRTGNVLRGWGQSSFNNKEMTYIDVHRPI